MTMLQLIKNQLSFGEKHEFQKIELVIYQNQRIGGDLLVKLVLVVLIARFFIGFERVNYLLPKVM
jgi:hypothetical protein